MKAQSYCSGQAKEHYRDAFYNEVDQYIQEQTAKRNNLELYKKVYLGLQEDVWSKLTIRQQELWKKMHYDVGSLHTISTSDKIHKLALKLSEVYTLRAWAETAKQTVDGYFTMLTMPSKSCEVERRLLDKYPNIRLVCYEKDAEIAEIIREKLPEAIVIQNDIDTFKGTVDFAWLDYCGCITNSKMRLWYRLRRSAKVFAITILAGHDKYQGHKWRVKRLFKKIPKQQTAEIVVLDKYHTKLQKGGVSAPMIFGLAKQSLKETQVKIELTDKVFKEDI